MTSDSGQSAIEAPQPSVPRVSLTIPRRFAINGKIAKNRVRKLAALASTKHAVVAPLQIGKAIGSIATTDDGDEIVFCQTRPSRMSDAWKSVIRVEEVDPAKLAEALASTSTRWLHPGASEPDSISVSDGQANVQRIVDTWRGRFSFKEEEYDSVGSLISRGLRKPQIGALHATLAHWSVSTAPATIVMPTGTGKTETMLAVLTCVRLPRVLVVVPTSILRDQITEKFLTLGVLKAAQCISDGAEFPIVATLDHRPKSIGEVDEIFLRSNVVVTTMQIAGQCTPDIQARMAEHCSHLFIDEAHHIAAATWFEFKSAFKAKAVLQFTATPFRTDGKRVDGKFIYTYPLSKAQEEGYFKPIRFQAVSEYDLDSADRAIAAKAIETLKADRAEGLDHVLMARVDNVDRADKIAAIYRRDAAEFKPVVIHSKVPSAERDRFLSQLRDRTSRIVICVDMFGEGFDFPELKIAALHDRHKSLAITLQFIGRFTRTQSKIGSATFIANIADDGISNALRNLYAEDADWNVLVQWLSQGATERAKRRAEVLEGFSDTLPDIPLQTLLPRMSAIAYKTNCAAWDPMKVQDVIQGTRLHAGPILNAAHNLAIFVTRDEEFVRWGTTKQILNVDWNLYVMHWNEDLGMLFINSSRPKDFHEHIAKAVCGAEQHIAGSAMFRVLHGIRRLTLTNLGLSHALGKNIRYTMFMGADITVGLAEAAQTNKRAANAFGLGFEDDEKTTIGCSFKGRLWSHRIAYDLGEWVAWCEHVGKKLLNDGIEVEGIFNNMIKPRRISERPPLVPVRVDWPEGFQDLAEELVDIQIGSTVIPFFDASIDVDALTDFGPLTFAVTAGTAKATFEIRLSPEAVTYVQISGAQAMASIRGQRKLLTEWFQDDPPIVYFATGDFLVFHELFELPRGDARRSFAMEKIDVWDWSGVTLSRESQGDAKDKTSIQRRVIERVRAGEFGKFDVVFDDDGSGEIADVVALRIDERNVHVDLFHCKYASGGEVGAKIENLYEVCGQAQKCVRWRESGLRMIKHMLSREAKRTDAERPSRFELGNKEVLQRIANSMRERGLQFKVHIVQPGMSKKKINPQILDLFGATENFLLDTYSIPLHVIASP